MSAIVRLPYHFRARPYQVDSFDAFYNRGIKNQLAVEHRRAGKDAKQRHMLVGEAIRVPANYVYGFPVAKQLRDSIWRGVDPLTGERFIDSLFPAPLLKRPVNNSHMYGEFLNGSTIQCLGMDEPKKRRGGAIRGIILSEMQDQKPGVLDVLSPMITQAKGFFLINGTPNGNKEFSTLFQILRANPDWHVTYLNVDQTKDWDGNRIITEEDLERERGRGMSEAMIRQEYYCDWNIGILGGYYSEQLDAAEREGRIGHVPFNPGQPVHTGWDIGYRDATAIWFYQFNGPYIDFINYFEDNGKPGEYYAAKLFEFSQTYGYGYGTHTGPPDVNATSAAASGRTFQSNLWEKGIQFSVLPAGIRIAEGVEAGRDLFKYARFDSDKCRLGVEALREHKARWDPVARVFSDEPEENWAIHGADAYRYVALATRKNFDRPSQGKSYPYSYKRP